MSVQMLIYKLCMLNKYVQWSVMDQPDTTMQYDLSLLYVQRESPSRIVARQSDAQAKGVNACLSHGNTFFISTCI
jgi:hypothetical protein